MEESLYRLTSDVLESPCMISPFYIAGGVSFLLFLHFWYWLMRVVHRDVHVLILWEVPHIMVKHTSLGHIKCWPLCSVDEKLIFILAVVGHRVIFMDQSKGQYVSYSLGV